MLKKGLFSTKMMGSGKTKEEVTEGGNLDEDIYSTTGREELMENEDEITDVDEGFMQGYEEGEKIAECAHCKKILCRCKSIL